MKFVEFEMFSVIFNFGKIFGLGWFFGMWEIFLVEGIVSMGWGKCGRF